LRAPRKRASAEVFFLLTIDYMEVRKGGAIFASLLGRKTRIPPPNPELRVICRSRSATPTYSRAKVAHERRYEQPSVAPVVEKVSLPCSHPLRNSVEWRGVSMESRRPAATSNADQHLMFSYRPRVVGCASLRRILRSCRCTPARHPMNLRLAWRALWNPQRFHLARCCPSQRCGAIPADLEKECSGLVLLISHSAMVVAPLTARPPGRVRDSAYWSRTRRRRCVEQLRATSPHRLPVWGKLPCA
jgi:hypothetical protein